MTIIIAWFLADILAGVVHWWEDQYLDGHSRFSFINRVSRDNDLHHEDPAFMGKLTFWENINTTVYIAWPVCLVLILIGAPVVCWLPVFFASFANAVHAMAHRPRFSTHYIIALLQRIGIFISIDHHIEHHYNMTSENYGQLIKKQDTTQKWCPMTNYMNPILDKIKFFKFLEFSLKLVGVKTTKERGK